MNIYGTVKELNEKGGYVLATIEQMNDDVKGKLIKVISSATHDGIVKPSDDGLFQGNELTSNHVVSMVVSPNPLKDKDFYTCITFKKDYGVKKSAQQKAVIKASYQEEKEVGFAYGNLENVARILGVEDPQQRSDFAVNMFNSYSELKVKLQKKFGLKDDYTFGAIWGSKNLSVAEDGKWKANKAGTKLLKSTEEAIEQYIKISIEGQAKVMQMRQNKDDKDEPEKESIEKFDNPDELI